MNSILKFIKKNRVKIALILIIAIGLFLRLYNFDNLLRFNADQLRDAQIIDNMHSQGEFPFFGPKAGGTKFKLGGAFYYLQYLSGTVFGFSPAGIATLIPILSTISIYLFYLLFKKIFSTNITLGLTFLYSISFYAIKYSHFAWNPNFIPFFVLSFLLILSNIITLNSKARNFILLGIVSGIGIQLHTTLLILMPLTILFSLIFNFINKRKINYLHLILFILTFVLINIPFIIGNVLDHGKNIQEFINGTSTKTSSSKSILKNIISDIEFFLQGNIYYLIGTEPTKNWSNLIKLIKTRNIAELSLLISSLAMFLWGGYLFFINKIKNKQNKESNKISLLLVTFSLLSFLFFILIGNKLNIRFFIILSFLPYLLLGNIGEYFINKNNSLKFKKTIVFFLIVLIISLNINIFAKTYNLNNYKAPSSAYGGVSLGELNEICSIINKSLESNPSKNKEVFIDSFEFNRSLKYICQKNDIKLTDFSKEKLVQNNFFFVITENKNAQKNIDSYSKEYTLQKSTNAKRFTVLLFYLK